jgi:hypothetical protein
VFENRARRIIFGSKRDDVTEKWRSCTMRSFIISTYPPPKKSLDQIKAKEVCRACGTHGRGEKSVQGFGGNTLSKETTRKTKA